MLSKLCIRPFAILMALATVSCATTQAAQRPPLGAPRLERQEGGLVHTTEQRHSTASTLLHQDSWRPESTKVRGVLVVMHGLKDYAERYEGLAQRLVEKGFAVYAFDLRGHGHSAGPRARIDRFDDYLDDLAKFMASVREREGNKPMFLFGHSMGGAIVTLYAERDQPQLNGLIVSAGALAADASGFTKGITSAIGSLFPGAGVLDLPNKDFSRDPKVVEAMTTDPLIDQSSIPARTVRELLRAQERLQNGAGTLKMPLLLLHGEKDTLTPPAGSRLIANTARSADKVLIIYPGLVHDLLHEPESKKVMNDITRWIEEHMPSSPSRP